MSVQFSTDDLHGHQGRQVLEDHLAEHGLPAKIRRAGERLLVSVPEGTRASARNHLETVAPDVDLQILEAGKQRIQPCPSCTEDLHGLRIGQWIDFTRRDAGDHIKCPRCDTELVVPPEGSLLRQRGEDE